jgi:hypothetical protein
MIIPNGYIETKVKTGGGIDDDGYPVEPEADWGDPIPCQYTINNYSNKGKANGEAFTIASYSILVEQMPQSYDSEQIRLTSNSGKELGEFSVIDVEQLEAVSQIRITV